MSWDDDDGDEEIFKSRELTHSFIRHGRTCVQTGNIRPARTIMDNFIEIRVRLVHGTTGQPSESLAQASIQQPSKPHKSSKTSPTSVSNGSMRILQRSNVWFDLRKKPSQPVLQPLL